MKCEQSERSIHRLLDGEARAVDVREVFEHLGACKDCRNFYDQLAATNSMIARQYVVPEYTMVPTTPQLKDILYNPSRILRAPRISTVALWLAIGVIILSLLTTSVTHESATSLNVPEYSLSPDMR